MTERKLSTASHRNFLLNGVFYLFSHSLSFSFSLTSLLRCVKFFFTAAAQVLWCIGGRTSILYVRPWRSSLALRKNVFILCKSSAELSSGSSVYVFIQGMLKRVKEYQRTFWENKETRQTKDVAEIINILWCFLNLRFYYVKILRRYFCVLFIFIYIK